MFQYSQDLWSPYCQPHAGPQLMRPERGENENEQDGVGDKKVTFLDAVNGLEVA